jgi:Mrp family chromosome partitioning ATPase
MISDSSPSNDLFDEIAARLHAAPERLRVVAFTSAVFAEGTSTLALGTAMTLAKMQSEAVLLVDANWLQPSLSADFGAKSRPGLAEIIRGEGRLADVVVATTRPSLGILPVGRTNLGELRLDGLSSMLTEARKRCRYVIIDLPPILASMALVLPWTSAVDQLFVVVRSEATPIGIVRDALARLEPSATPAFILNAVRRQPTLRYATLAASS